MCREPRRANTSHVRPLALAVIVLLGSCARHVPSAAVTLRIAGVGPLENLGPQLNSGYSMLVKGLVFPLMLEPRTEGGWRSQVVQEWARLGPRVYRLKLDPSIRFSDGSPVRPDDAIASLAAFGIRGTEREGWIEIEPVSDDAPIDTLLLHVVLFKESPEGILGTGAFAVVIQDPERIVLRRMKSVAGRIGQVELASYASHREAFAGALRGEADALLLLDRGEVELLDGVARFQLVRGPSLHSIAAVFNAQLLSRTERKALADSVDVGEIGQANGGDCDLEGPPQLVRSKPWAAPLELGAMGADPAVVRISLALRRSLGARGPTVEIDDRQLGSLMAAGSLDIAVMPMQVWPDAATGLMFHTGASRNRFGYSNPALDEALDSGDYIRAQRELAEDPPAIFICRRLRNAAIDVRVKNPKLGPYDLLQSLPDWEVNP